MKTYIFPADRFGSGSYRLIWPAQALHNQGHQVVIVDPANRDSAINCMMDKNTGEMVDVQIPEDADVMVFQRISHAQIVKAIPLIRKRGVAVVIDMDDDLSTIHPSNPAFAFMHPKGPYPDHSWHNAQIACESATMLVASAPSIVAKYAPHGRGRVFHNYVPGFMLDIPHVDSDVIGWPGSVHSHPDDLQAMGTAPARLAQAGHTLAAIGDGKGVQEAWGLPAHVPVHASGTVDIQQWGHAVTKLGIGVVPLADTVFNQSKSWLKGIEMAAVGVPFVASPRTEYVRLHKEAGLGLLAKDQKDWYRKLHLLATNEQMRLETSLQGRETMADYTIEGNAWRLAEIWREALRIQRKSGTALRRVI